MSRQPEYPEILKKVQLMQYDEHAYFQMYNVEQTNKVRKMIHNQNQYDQTKEFNTISTALGIHIVRIK